MTNQIINHTNARLSNWYKDAFNSYGVVGKGTTTIEGNQVTINYSEDGVEKVWNMIFYPEYVIDGGIDYIFNVWMEEAKK